MLPRWRLNVTKISSKYLNQIKSYDKKKITLLKNIKKKFSRVLEKTPSQFFDFMLSTNVSCHHKISKKIHLKIHEKFHFEFWANFNHSKIFNSVEFKIFKNAKLTLMLWSLKQAIIRANRLSLSKVIAILVRPSIAGNTKKMDPLHNPESQNLERSKSRKTQNPDKLKIPNTLNPD
jgi:hypothetical protein